MKVTFIILNLVAAIVFNFLGSVAIAIHRVHSYSMYQEFIAVGAVDEQKLATIPQLPNLPPSAHYDMPARLRQIGDADTWFTRISGLASVVCIFNTAVIFFLFRKREAKNAT